MWVEMSFFAIRVYGKIYIGVKDRIIERKRVLKIVWAPFENASRFSCYDYAQEFIDKNNLLHAEVLEVTNEMRNTD